MSNRQAPLPYVLYHFPCPDGMGAAYSAWRHFGDKARYIGINYGDKLPPLRARTDLYLLDFSFKRQLMLELAQLHPRIVVIDHHISAEKELQGIQDEAPNIEIVFDNNHTGAWLAWEYFFPDTTAPWLLPYVEDRDIWKHELPDTQEINAAVNTYPMDFLTWDKIIEDGPERLIQEGRAILRYTEGKKVDLARSARLAQIGEFSFPAVNAPHFLASDLGHHLLDIYPDAPFAGTYRDEKDGRRSWSLRSEDDRVDVQVLASALGGGGHRNASGLEEEFAGEKIFMGSVAWEDRRVGAGPIPLRSSLAMR